MGKVVGSSDLNTPVRFGDEGARQRGRALREMKGHHELGAPRPGVRGTSAQAPGGRATQQRTPGPTAELKTRLETYRAQRAAAPSSREAMGTSRASVRQGAQTV